MKQLVPAVATEISDWVCRLPNEDISGKLLYSSGVLKEYNQKNFRKGLIIGAIPAIITTGIIIAIKVTEKKNKKREKKTTTTNKTNFDKFEYEKFCS